MSRFIKIITIIIIGLAIIILSLYKTPVRNTQQKNYQVEINPYSLVFYTKDLEEVLKISPLDDYYYLVNSKDHLIKDSSFQQTRDLFTDFVLTLERLIFNKQRLVWSLQKDKIKATYEIRDTGNGVTISRTLKGFSPKIDAIGQAISFCRECFLADENNQVYITEDQLTQEKLDQIQKLNLTPLIINNDQLPRVSRLIILSPFGKKRLEILISADQQIFYFKNWNVLELKTPVSSEKVVKVSQIVKF